LSAQGRAEQGRAGIFKLFSDNLVKTGEVIMDFDDVLSNLIQRVDDKIDISIAKAITKIIIALEPNGYGGDPFKLFDRWTISKGSQKVTYGLILYIDGQQWTITRSYGK
jgi:hypothetical protein